MRYGSVFICEDEIVSVEAVAKPINDKRQKQTADNSNEAYRYR